VPQAILGHRHHVRSTARRCQ